MAQAQWGSDPEFFGPRHEHREARILDALGGSLRNEGGFHLECAAGLGSLSRSIAHMGKSVIAVDLSLPSLLKIKEKTLSKEDAIFPVIADINFLPFPDCTFSSASSAETLEHIPDDHGAVSELGRVLLPGGALVGTVPAGPKQWSDWDIWADHKRRYTKDSMELILREAGLEPAVKVWGWPFLRFYDGFFLKKVNRRRLKTLGPAEQDPALRKISRLGRHRRLVGLVKAVFSLDHLFDHLPWGVGLLFVARKPEEGQDGLKLVNPSSSLP